MSVTHCSKLSTVMFELCPLALILGDLAMYFLRAEKPHDRVSLRMSKASNQDIWPEGGKTTCQDQC